MDGAEFFRPGEAGESYDPAAFERFKEQMKKNAAFMAAAKKSEQRQKEKEDRLAKILLAFIQKNQKRGILLLAAKLLAENIPASFVLSIIVLGNEDMRAEIDEQMKQLEQGKEREPVAAKSHAAPSPTALAPKITDRPSLSPASGGAGGASFHTLPLQLKVALDSWAQNMVETASVVPFRVIETALDKEGELKQVVVDCAANVLDDFLATSGFREVPYSACFSFCELFMKNLMQQLKKQIEDQKMLS